MTNQTSIEWLIEQCPRIETIVANSVLEQAKEMHKQEIIDAVEEFSARGTGTCYYNETFNK